MNSNHDRNFTSSSHPRAHFRWWWLALLAAALLLLIWPFRASRREEARTESDPEGATKFSATSWLKRIGSKHGSASLDSVAPATAEEIVAGKLSRFARSRRELAYALAQRHGVQVSGDVERFFAAVESGRWDDIESAFKKINGGDSSASSADTRSPEVAKLWPAIIDAFGVAEQVHEWPAQKLLDYGNSILDSLRPGMVYVGGTDNGRWIPELLNETSDGERHIIVTQNGLAANDYLDYVRLQYDDRLSTLTEADSQRAFQEYVADAQKRFEHDQQFPSEPKQVRPGEDIRMEDGKTTVSGQIAVMSINEKLLQALMAKNPDLTFALQESFPLRGTYGDALPLGPLMELRAGNEQNTFTAERAAQSLDYWRDATQQMLSDTSAPDSTAALKSYSHDVVAAANLLASHNFSGEAEQAYRLAAQLWPENPESVGGLADVLSRAGRESEAQQLLNDFVQKHPAQQKDLERASAAWRAIISPPTPKP